MMPEAPTNVLSNANLDILLSDGNKDVAVRTECLETTYDQDVTAAQQEYDLASDCVRLLGVYYGGSGSWEKLPEVTTDHLANEIDPDWFDLTGEILAYFKRGNKVGLYKTPTSKEAGTSYLRQFYVQQANTLTNDSDSALRGYYHLASYSELVILYAMYKAKQMLGLWEQAKTIELEYFAKCKEMKLEVHRLDDFQQVIRPYYKGIGGASMKQNPLQQ